MSCITKQYGVSSIYDGKGFTEIHLEIKGTNIDIINKIDLTCCYLPITPYDLVEKNISIF
jgi:hypothetical protein